MEEEQNSNRKVLLVGDERCGKIGLIWSYFAGKLPPDEPQIYKEYKTKIEVGGEEVPLEIWIAPVQDCYSQIRTLSYEGSEAILLCFSVDNPDSLKNAAEKWFLELEKYAPNVPVVLVGNKTDLRTDQSQDVVTYEQGKEMADKLKCFQYVENSAKNVENVKEVFRAAATAILAK